MRGKTRRAKTASLRHERHYQRAGCRVIIGVDEAGRGPLAGPVAAAAVALPLERPDLRRALRGARDSKDMTAIQRESLVDVIQEIALTWGIGSCGADEIDDMGIAAAVNVTMLRALDEALARRAVQPDCLFLDYALLPERRDIPQVSLVGGDRRSLSIACASVLAKVWRDAFMRRLDALYPQYGLGQNKGYPSSAHLRALREFGPSPAHRRSFRPVALASQCHAS